MARKLKIVIGPADGKERCYPNGEEAVVENPGRRMFGFVGENPTVTELTGRKSCDMRRKDNCGITGKKCPRRNIASS